MDPAAGPEILLLSRDLFFGSRITGTARELGYSATVLGNPSDVAEAAAQPNCRLLLIDLGLPSVNVQSIMDALPAGARPHVIAFGAHVQGRLLQEAQAAGCDEVLTRNRLTAELPELLRRALSGDV